VELVDGGRVRRVDLIRRACELGVLDLKLETQPRTGKECWYDNRTLPSRFIPLRRERRFVGPPVVATTFLIRLPSGSRRLLG
jgi:hypothetical protein